MKNSSAVILAALPLTLFFPVGLMYAGVLFFLLTFTLSGDYLQKWQNIKNNPLFIPIISLSLVSIVIGLIQDRDASEFWSGFIHYQTYLFLLLFIAIGSGAWQQKAIHTFFAGAIISASIFYLDALHVLPQWKFFRSYQLYEGNKSILIGLLLAISSAWMLHEWRIKKNYHFIRMSAFFYIIIALILFARSRTALLLFLLLSSLMVLRYCRFNWKLIPATLGVCFVLGAGIYYLNKQASPITCLSKEMQFKYQMNGTDILVNRAICTVHQVRDFNNNKAITQDGMRLELYSYTLTMALEKPLIGHGIGNWLGLYREKAKGSISEEMTTPHNDYLLYFFELGIVGLLVLLWILMSQLWTAKKMAQSQYSQYSDKAMLLSMLSLAIIFSALFNAILRDGLFSMAMMILLAIPMAGFDKTQFNKNTSM